MNSVHEHSDNGVTLAVHRNAVSVSKHEAAAHGDYSEWYLDEIICRGNVMWSSQRDVSLIRRCHVFYDTIVTPR